MGYRPKKEGNEQQKRGEKYRHSRRHTATSDHNRFFIDDKKRTWHAMSLHNIRSPKFPHWGLSRQQACDKRVYIPPPCKVSLPSTGLCM